MGIHWTGIVFGLGLGDLVRLLDHRLPGGAARAFRQGPALARKLAPIIGVGFQDGGAVHRDSSRPAGAGRAAR